MGTCMLSSRGGSAVLIPPKPLPGVAGVLGVSFMARYGQVMAR